MKEIVVYDFDKTLTYKDTIFGFFKAVANRDIFYFPKLFVYFSFMVFAKLGFISNTTLKEYGIKLFLKGVSKTTLDKKATLYAKTIKTNSLYRKVIDRDEDEDIYIISASFSEYISKLFKKNIKIISSKIIYKDNKVEKLGFNCYKDSKIEALKEQGITRIDRFYTDSMADFEVAKISKRIFVVKGDEVTEVRDIEEFYNFFHPQKDKKPKELNQEFILARG